MFGPTPGSKSKVGQNFPRGTTMLFIQSAAPFGWTRISTFDDSLLRIVGTATPSNGGSNGFNATFNTQTATGAFTLTTATIPSHQHSTGLRFYSPDTSAPFATPTGTAAWGFSSVTNTDGGSGGSHSHSITTSIKFVDALIAKKN